MSSDLSRILWACRRGMLELDLLLAPFAKEHWQHLSDAEKAVFADLLSCQDQDLYQSLLGEQRLASPDLQAMIEKIRTYASNQF